MKKNLTVLVLLVMWSLLSIPTLASAACADALPEKPVSGPGPALEDLIFTADGAVDDGSSGDPGDAGDGYGISDQPDLGGDGSGFQGVDGLVLDELWLILMSLIQLAL